MVMWGRPSRNKSGTGPGTPSGIDPGTPSGIDPGTPSGIDPGTPSGIDPGTPSGTGGLGLRIAGELFSQVAERRMHWTYAHAMIKIRMGFC
jgi:hypothetical protein